METLGDTIKKLRKSKGLSLRQLANELAVSDMTLSKIETGKTKSITIELGKKLSSALEISFLDLFEIEGANQTDENVNEEIKLLKKRIIELEDQLRDKKLILDVILSDDIMEAIIPDYFKNIKGGKLGKDILTIVETALKSYREPEIKKMPYLKLKAPKSQNKTFLFRFR